MEIKNILTPKRKTNVAKAVVTLVIVTLLGVAIAYLGQHRTALIFALTNEKEVLMVREARLKLDDNWAKVREEKLSDFLGEKVVILSPLPDSTK